MWFFYGRQVFLEFAKHQLEEKDDDAKAQELEKKKSLLRQQSLHGAGAPAGDITRM